VLPSRYKVKVQCPATRHGGTWAERRHSSYSFLTSTLDGGEWSASRPGRNLPPGKGPPVPIVQKAGWAPEPVWTQRLEEKSSVPVGDRTPIVDRPARSQTLYCLSYRGSHRAAVHGGNACDSEFRTSRL
jgi:hypothetical protein